jgi:hypothetical protein
MIHFPALASGIAKRSRRQPPAVWSLPLLLMGAVTACVACPLEQVRPRGEAAYRRGVDTAGLDPPAAQLGGNDYALLIATDRYDHWPELPNPLDHIASIHKELEEIYGFSVERLVNPKRRELTEKLREYANRKDLGPRDQLFIFIAGHGVYDDLTETGYLVTRDSELLEDDPTFDSYLPYPLSLKLIAKIPAGHILLAADACFSGTLDSRVASRGDDIYRYSSNADYLRRKLELRTRRYITSGGKEPVPDHSPFARAMLEGLRSFGGSDGILTLDELIAHHLEGVLPLPRWGEFGDNDPGSTFLFVVKSRRIAPDPVPLPLDIGDAVGYCDAGGSRNVEKSISMFRAVLEELAPAERSRLDPELLERAGEEYRQGSAQKTCWLFKALFTALHSTGDALN